MKLAVNQFQIKVMVVSEHFVYFYILLAFQWAWFSEYDTLNTDVINEIIQVVFHLVWQSLCGEHYGTEP